MLNLAPFVAKAANASQARQIITAALNSLVGGIAFGLTREQAEALVKDCGLTVSNKTLMSGTAPDGREYHSIQHSMKGPELKQLRADLNALKKDAVKHLPVRVSPKAYQLDGEAVLPALMDMTVKQLSDLMEMHGVKATIHNGVVTMGAGKKAIYADATDGAQLAGKDEAAVRQMEGKLNALSYIVEKGGKLTKNQRALLDEANGTNDIAPGTVKIPTNLVNILN